LYEQIHELEEQLAKLSHYNSVAEMYNDDRWLQAQTGFANMPEIVF
jgi:hypothetical protein